MARVLFVGESWFTYSVRHVGFDTLHAVEYSEGGHEFREALRSRGHAVTYVPAHQIHDRVPTTAEDFAAYDVVVISDVGVNSFQLGPATLIAGTSVPDKAELLRGYVDGGGALLMVGGYLSFSGIGAKARWGRSPLAAALPVEILDRDDRVELPAGVSPTVVADHLVVSTLSSSWPPLLGLNELRVRPSGTLLAECAGHPLLVLGSYGLGRSAAFASDIAPHWAPRPFLEWEGYAELWDRLVRWLANGDPLSSPPITR